MGEADGGTSAAPAGRPVRGWMGREVRMALEILGLTGLVVTQPVLAIFQGSADVFVIRRAAPVDVVLFAVLVALLPAVVLWAVGALVGLAGAGPRRVAHVATLGALGGLLVLLVAEDVTSLGPALLLVLAGAGAVGVGLLAWRQPVARLLCRYLAAGSVVFVGVFLFASPVAPVVRPAGADADAADTPAEVAPVLMIVLDELPTLSLLNDRGQVDPERFPALAGLAEGATWYRNHSTVAPVTPSAVPAILSGQLPEPDVVPVASAHPDNLFTVLAGTHDVHATESLTRLCPDDVCAGRPTAPTRVVVRSLLGTATDLWRERISPANDAEVDFTVSDQWFDPASADRLSEFAPSLAPSGERPRLDFLHVLLPHQPWHLLPDGEEYEAPNPPPGAPYLSVWADQHAADVARQRHLLQLQYVDRALGEIFDRMRAIDTFDETLIVVTADHGVAFTQEAATRALYTETATEIMWTPFFVKRPDQRRGEVIDTPMQSIDDLPTIAAALGIELGFDTDGTAGGAGDPGDGADERLMLDYRFHETHPEDGDFLTVDGAAAFADLLDAEPLGEPSGGLGLYRIGPDAELIGRSVDSLEVGDPVEGAVTITTTGAYLSGTTDLAAPRRLAVVVGGRVVAAPTLYDDGTGVTQFFAMVPPQWRTDDADAVTVHVIDGPAGAAVLHPVAEADQG